jgi:hypothetical protein
MSDPVSDLKRELLAAAERQQGHAAALGNRPQLRAHLGRNRLLLTAATLFVAATFALLFTSPWSNSRSFLARAEAALTPPAGMILHEKSEATTTSTDPACTVAHGPSEIWIDEKPPYRYRVLGNDFPPDSAIGPRELACASGTAAELGGTFGSGQTLRFVPPNTLAGLPFRLILDRARLDPVTGLREAISAGTAHDEGKTQLDGRTVERIRIDPPSSCSVPGCPREPGYAYVDPETFYPVQTESPQGFIAQAGAAIVRFRTVERIVTYEYLPRTAANLALTDIRAQHPNATGP